MKEFMKTSILLACTTALILLSLNNAQASPQPKKISGVVNINDATPDQLQLLPGIGPAKAKTIVQYRSKRPFKSPRDLIKVKGIGKKLFEKVRTNVVVQGQTTLKNPSKTQKGTSP